MQRAEYGVQIDGADNGIVVRVGCKTLVFAEDRIDEALADLKQLLIGGYKASQELLAKYYPNQAKVADVTGLQDRATEEVTAPHAQVCARGLGSAAESRQ